MIGSSRRVVRDFRINADGRRRSAAVVEFDSRYAIGSQRRVVLVRIHVRRGEGRVARALSCSRTTAALAIALSSLCQVSPASASHPADIPEPQRILIDGADTQHIAIGMRYG